MTIAGVFELFGNISGPAGYFKSIGPGLGLAPLIVAVMFILLAIAGDDDRTSFTIYAATALFFLFVAVLLMMGRPQIEIGRAHV